MKRTDMPKIEVNSQHQEILIREKGQSIIAVEDPIKLFYEKNVNTEVYNNREMSWLKFNKRVLEEAMARENPLFERLRFISIFSSNLDEFYMVRVGSLYDRTLLKDNFPDNKTMLSPMEQLEKIYEYTAELIARKDEAYDRLSREFEGQGIYHISLDKLEKRDLLYLEDYFNGEILPLLSPQIIDNKHPFPHLANKFMYIGLILNASDHRLFGVIPVSDYLDNMVILPSVSSLRYVLIEDVIYMFAGKVFKKYDIVDKVLFRITRNADLEAEEAYFEEDADYRLVMKELLKKRKKLAAVRIEMSKEPLYELQKYLCEKLNVSGAQVFYTKSPMRYGYISQVENELHQRRKTNLFYHSLTPQKCTKLLDTEKVMHLVQRQDLFFTYPFQSVAPLILLLNEAAADKNVVSIKITLYRLCNDSKIIDALIEAAENGKDVVAAVELKARFDEANNIIWSNKLEEAGCKVIYGLGDLKVHSKILLITKREGKKMQYITHIGTGNYNENTARVYTDCNIITTNSDIGEDAVRFFNNLTLVNFDDTYKRFLVSPFGIKSEFLKRVDKEIEFAQKRGSGRIIAKLNALTDKEIIDKLIEASMAGVKIDLIIRGICCLQPGIAGKTDNIKVISIVGRFLEHSRIYYFYNGGVPDIFISSADLMTRNMEKRVEIAVPVLDNGIKTEIEEMLYILLSDNVKGRVLHEDREYYHRMNRGEPRLDSQMYLYEEAYRKASATAHKPLAITNGRTLSESFKDLVSRIIR